MYMCCENNKSSNSSQGKLESGNVSCSEQLVNPKGIFFARMELMGLVSNLFQG